MNFRYKFSIILIVLGIISAIMSFRNTYKSGISPQEILNLLESKKYIYTSDQLAHFINEEDSAIQIIDIRSMNDFHKACLPGAVNIPFNELFNPENEHFFTQGTLNKIIVENDDQLSTQAWILAMQAGYLNTFILKGGMNEWDSIVMLSEFRGNKITPRENALFETRYKARRLFNEWNSMSDSLKAGFYKAKKKKERELVGGCE